MGNWIVGGILVVIVVLIVRYLVKQWKGGHGFCAGGDCKSCGHCSSMQTPSACSRNCTGCKGYTKDKSDI